MIPLATPRNGEIINLAAVARIKQLDDGAKVRVVFTDGQTETYDGQACQHFMSEILFLLDQYRQLQKLAAGQAGNIILPNDRVN